MIRFGTAMALVFGLLGMAMAQPALPRARGFDTDSIGIDQKLGATVPLATKWKDENGNDVRLGDYFNNNQPVIIVPVFFQCKGACLVVLDATVKSVVALHAKYPDQPFTVVSFSINPKETPVDARIRQELITKVYEETSHTEKEAKEQAAVAKSSWHFLTGDIDSITELTTAIGFRFTYEPKIDRINHATGIMVASSEGKLTNYFYGREYAAPLLRTALEQARRGTVGTATQPILLGCFMMDPETGKYRVVVGRALQVGGIGTVLILGTSIFVLSKKNRQRSRLRPDGGSDSE